MKCPNCNHRAKYVRVTKVGTRCDQCGGFSATGGKSTENVLSRTSTRVRDQHVEHEADMVQPFVYDENQKKQIVNEDFIKLYPDRARDFYSEDELKDVGYGDLPQSSEDEPDDVDMSEIEYNGKSEQAINSLLEQHKERQDNEHQDTKTRGSEPSSI